MHSISYIKASQLTWSLQCDIWHKKSLCESGIHRSFEKSLQLMKIFMENKSYIIYKKFMIVFLPTISWNKWGTAIWTVECSCEVQLSRQWSVGEQTVRCRCRARCCLGSEAECQTGVTWGVRLGVTCRVKLGVTQSVKLDATLSVMECSCPVWLSRQWSVAVWAVKCSCPGSEV